MFIKVMKEKLLRTEVKMHVPMPKENKGSRIPLHIAVRLMTMSPSHPCGKICSTETHNETVKKLPLYSVVISEIMMESLGNVFNSAIE